MDGGWVEGRLVEDDWVEEYKRRQGGDEPRKRRRWLVVGAMAVALMLIAAATLVLMRRDGDDRAAPLAPGQADAEVFLAAWSAGNTERMQELVSDPNAHVAKDLEEATTGLHPRGSRFTLDAMDQVGDTTTATFTAVIDVGGLGPWTYHGALPLVSTPDGYRVRWSLAAIHPSLHATFRLDRTRERAPRASILGARDQPLVAPRPAVTIGLWPSHIKDQAALTTALSAALHLDPSVITKPLSAPGLKPDDLIPIVTVPKDEYLRLKPLIYDIPGVNFPESTRRMAPMTGFAAHVLGRAGEITAEKLTELGPTYEKGDIVGLSGLEAQFESTLGGSPSGDIRIVDPTGRVTDVLQHVQGATPAPVRTTIDTAAQLAAERALADVAEPAAIVAVDGDGNIRAAASRPLTEAFNRAILGSYPPGSTFKVVTSAALLHTGVSTDATLACPPSLTVDGKEFHNAEAEQQAQLSLADAFAMSCNTAFIGAAQKLPSGALRDAAAVFGFGVDYDIGVKSAGGSFPAAASGTGAAAASIGQGDVVASPLHMATVAAAVRSGQWRAPRLLTASDATTAATSAPAPAPIGAALDASTRTQLDELMHAVVVRGTGTSAAVVGRDVAGKTGTAEFGTDAPPRTHAWFIGFSGELSVAVVVEGGGFGGKVAAPMAATFFATATP
jgi:cell division protein FtsI/penicillin-binding protein 2